MAEMRRASLLTSLLLLSSAGCAASLSVGDPASLPTLAPDEPAFSADAVTFELSRAVHLSPDVSYPLDAPSLPAGGSGLFVCGGVVSLPPRTIEIYATATQTRSIYSGWIRPADAAVDPVEELLEGGWIRDDVPTPRRITSP